MARPSRSRSTSRTTPPPASSRARSRRRAASSRSSPSATCAARSSSSASSPRRIPAIVKEIADGGHELGAPRLPPHAAHRDRSRDVPPRDRRRARAFMEDIAGQPVLGFRAPTFSLVESTVWATDVLAELGFRYSSSVLPARSPLYGYPGRPRTPHRWPSGLLELPCPVADLGPITNPYLGGIYLRVLPWTAVRYGLDHAAPRRDALGLLPPVRLRSRASRSRSGPTSGRGSHGSSGSTAAACSTGSIACSRPAAAHRRSASASTRSRRQLIVVVRPSPLASCSARRIASSSASTRVRSSSRDSSYEKYTHTSSRKPIATRNNVVGA